MTQVAAEFRVGTAVPFLVRRVAICWSTGCGLQFQEGQRNSNASSAVNPTHSGK